MYLQYSRRSPRVWLVPVLGDHCLNQWKEMEGEKKEEERRGEREREKRATTSHKHSPPSSLILGTACEIRQLCLGTEKNMLKNNLHSWEKKLQFIHNLVE